MAFEQKLQALLDDLNITKVAMRRDAEGWNHRQTAEHWYNAIKALLAHPDYAAAEKTDGRRAALPGSPSAQRTAMPALTELMVGLANNLRDRILNPPPGHIVEGLKEIQKAANQIAIEIDDYQDKRDKWFDTDFEKELAAKGVADAEKVEDLEAAPA